ncbi:MAG TPA: response regulator [Patescibacteria group bacterium]|nr:response regulator [bacterium]HRY56829.1 response regulator [Patescibacteria group bacterium]
MDEKKVLKNNILIVEDEHDIREIYAEVLNMAGYVVDQVADGEKGMQKIRDDNWDILLLDIMLPGKDGIKILKEIKDHPELKKGIVIALTNLNSENIIQEVFGSGADGYLIKSEITPDKVVEEVARILANQEAGRN